MNFYDLQQIDISDFKSILTNQRELMIQELEKLIDENSQSPSIVSRSKLLKILDCSASWLSKVTTNGEMPSITIGGRVFYDLRELSKKNLLNRLAINKNDRRLKWVLS